MQKSTAILGGGIAGLTAAWQMHQLGHPFTLYEASSRLGGPIETIRRDGFTIELGPDGWISEKPWASELARDLGLGDELIASNDATRVTWIVQQGALVAIPDGMRMMVPTNLDALAASPLFTPEALAAYAAEPACSHELRAQAPDTDESIATFIERHFGSEVLHKIGAPLLSGVFGGNVETLSVRAVMPNFVAMERTHGSLILALEQIIKLRGVQPPQPIFTTLRSGTQTLIDRMAAALPANQIRLNTPVTALARTDGRWAITTASETHLYDQITLALPAHAAAPLLAPLSPRAAELLTLDASSAILVAFAFTDDFALPQGFGFLAPAGESAILAATFTDQKYPHRAPAGQRLLRAFFGGQAEFPQDPRTDEELTTLALAELRRILSPEIPDPAFTLVRRWPRSLPQYAVGHLDRVAELTALTQEHPGLHLLGNPYRGVGLPDLIRDARATARMIAS